jgi:hypothetical protein
MVEPCILEYWMTGLAMILTSLTFKRMTGHSDEMEENSFHAASYHVPLIITTINRLMSTVALNVEYLFVRCTTITAHNLARKSKARPSRTRGKKR